MVELEGPRRGRDRGGAWARPRACACCSPPQGVAVVVNDRGVASDGTGSDPTPCSEVVAEITAHGGRAVGSDHDIATWDGARAAVELAVESFGDLDILVNNAGILRDTTIVSMSEFDFDEVLRVHMKGQAAPTHWAAAYWRDQHHAGIRRPRNLVHTSSTSGIYANPGQSNYGSAKSGIVTFSQIAAKELARYSVVSNCVVPGARTRLTMSSPGLPEIMEAPADGFDVWSPGNVSPLVAYLVAPAARSRGRPSTCRAAPCGGSNRGRSTGRRSRTRRAGRSTCSTRR